MTDLDPRASIRRAGGWALAGGLTLAAFVAIIALLAGSFGELELRVMLTSVGFSFFGAMSASGAALRLRPSGTLQRLGTATTALSALAFVLLLVGLWSNMDDWGGEGIWQAFGCSAVVALACAHAGAVLGARRPTDSGTIGTLVSASLILGAIDTLALVLAIAGMADVDEGAQLLSASLVLLLLTTALPPILRRLQRAPATPKTPAAGTMEFVLGEIDAIAGRIAQLNESPSPQSPQIRREVQRLQELARSFQS